jgi:mRNA interferase HigB
MRIVSRNALTAYAAKHPNARIGLEFWFEATRAAAWPTSSDVLTTFRRAKVLNAERVRFEIQGGDFRLVAAINYRRQIVFVKFVGTHAEYDRIDALTVSMF